MSAADDEAWQAWEAYRAFKLMNPEWEEPFEAGYRRALDDLTSEFYASGDPCKVAVAELLTARAAAVAPRETKD